MKKLLIFILSLIVLTSISFATTSETFGYNQANSWSDWTGSNIQHTQFTEVGQYDGYVLCGLVASSTWEDFNSLAGWSSSGTGSYVNEISPAGQLHQASWGGSNGSATLDRNGWMPSDNTFTIAMMVKFVGTEYMGSNNNGNGCQWTVDDGTRKRHAIIRSRSVEATWQYTRYDSSYGDETTVSVESDVDRFHLYAISNNNANDADIISMDGQRIVTGGNNYAVGDNTMQLSNVYYSNGTISTAEQQVDWIKPMGSFDYFSTIDGTLESNSSASVFTTPATDDWYSVDYTWSTHGSSETFISVEARTAATIGGIAGASYFVVTSGEAFASGDQKDVIQIRATFSDAESGRYTPRLDSITLNSTTEPPVVLIGPFTGHGSFRRKR